MLRADPLLPVIDLGRMSYADAYAEQERHHAAVVAARAAGTPELGRLLTVEHPPVITVPDKPGDAAHALNAHVLASPELLRGHGIERCATDRGGDVTYHGPGQLVVYPIIDLHTARLRLHDYMRTLEQAVIDALAHFGIHGHRDPTATGVWVASSLEGSAAPHAQPAKIAAMGVRVRRWVTLHGLSLNVDPAMEHFGLIVPCGLAGRPVTSLRQVLGPHCPSMDDARDAVVRALMALLKLGASRAD